MLALCLTPLNTYHAQNYAGIVATKLRYVPHQIGHM